LRTESVAVPWKPTIITAPISWSSVSPPGPGRSVGEASAGGDAAVDGVGDCATDEDAQPATNTASNSANLRTFNLSKNGLAARLVSDPLEDDHRNHTAGLLLVIEECGPHGRLLLVKAISLGAAFDHTRLSLESLSAA